MAFPLIEQIGLVPKSIKDDGEKSLLQITEDKTGRGEDDKTETTLRVTSHTTETNLTSPNCTKERVMLTMPVALILTVRPLEEATSKQRISVGDRYEEGADTTTPLCDTKQADFELKFASEVWNETFTDDEARANVGDIVAETAEGADVGRGAIGAVVAGAGVAEVDAEVDGAVEEAGEGLGGSLTMVNWVRCVVVTVA